MAESRRPGVINPPMGSCKVPGRTPGVLGICDRADPNTTTLMGSLPGILGLHDWADPSLPWLSDLDWPRPGTVCRAGDGSALSMGPAPAAAPAQTTDGAISLELAQEMALKITTHFEGGKSMNYQALAGDFDGQGTSFGLIQWNFGQNTLGPLLKKMLAYDAKAFAKCFSADAGFETLKKALDENNQAAQLKWARALQKDQKAAWTAAFRAIGAVESFNGIQRQEASAQYQPLVVKAVAHLRGLRSDLMKAVEFRSYAALFDLCVQQHGLAKASDAIKSRVDKEKPATQLDLLRIAMVERGRKASKAWVSDCISRRMGILDGAVFESTEHEITKKRANPQYSLVGEFGRRGVGGL